MKKFTISAIFAMALVTISSAAFANGAANRGDLFGQANDTVAPADTNAPAKSEVEPALALVTDTVVPKKEDCPEKDCPQKQNPAKDEPQKEEPAKDEPVKQQLNDTVVPTDTITPQKQEPAK